MRSLTSFSHFSSCTNQFLFSSVLVLLRIVIGVQFFLSGINKMDGWSAESYLENASGPFYEFFQSLAGNILVDQLNIWGLTIIGLALILGVFVRPASFFASILMVLYYISNFVENTEYSVVNEHIVYIFIFILFMTGGIGHIFGIDSLLMQNTRKKKWWQVVLFG